MKAPSLRCVLIAAFLAVMAGGCGSGDPSSYVESAKRYLTASDYPAAIIELKNALKVDPNRAEARYLLAEASLRSGNFGDAQADARKALELKYPPDQVVPLLLRALLAGREYQKVVTEPIDGAALSAPARAEAETTRALAYLAMGDRKAARAAIESALSADPSQISARIAQVRLRVAEQDPAGALSVANEILASAPGNVDASILKADILGALARREEAIKTLEQAVEVKPDNLLLRWALIVALVKSGQVADAERQLAAVKAAAPEHPQTFYSEALLAYAQGKTLAASAAIERSKHFAPDYLPALYLSALIDFRREAWGSAETALRAVVAKVPDDEAARKALAATLVRRGKTSQALDVLAPLLRRAPNDPQLLRAAAEVYLASSNLPKAVEYFAKANQVDAGSVPGQIRLAQARLASGDAAQAIKDLESLAASDPTGSSEPALALIGAYMQRREFDKALDAVAAIEKKQPKSPMVHNVKGVVYMASGDAKEARASFEKALELDAEFGLATFNLARLDIVERNAEGARARYQKLLAKNPSDEQALLALAELLVATRASQDEARATIERAIAASPTSVRARIALVSYYGHRKEWDAAVGAAQKAQVAVPDNAQIVEALGAMQFAAGQTNQAIESFRRAAQMQPDDPAPLIRLAELQTKIKDYDAAIDSLRNAVELQPELTGLWLALCDAYVTANRAQAGIDYGRRQQKLQPDRAVGYAIEAELLARQQKWPESAGIYRLVLARQPAPYAITRLHGVLSAANKASEANAVVQQWLKDHPSDVAVRSYLAEQRMANKDFRAAATYLLAALREDPHNALVLNNLGWTLNELHDPKALDYAARAYAQAPDNAETADTYGWVLVSQGDAGRGVEILRQAVELNPGDAAKRIRLAKGLVRAGNKDAARKELESIAHGEGPSSTRLEAEQMLKTL
jgi:putative PEP-CTERM system TPR-repeat lipoprotein